MGSMAQGRPGGRSQAGEEAGGSCREVRRAVRGFVSARALTVGKRQSTPRFGAEDRRSSGRLWLLRAR